MLVKNSAPASAQEARRSRASIGIRSRASEPAPSADSTSANFALNWRPSREWAQAIQNRTTSNYPIAGREVVAEGADLRVQVLTLAGGQCVPWHYHSEITDSFVCLEGPMVVETRAPRNSYRLEPGQRCAVPPKTAHYVHGENDGPCKFLIIQGVGVYDFVAVG